jgi:hypothetical protein
MPEIVTPTESVLPAGITAEDASVVAGIMNELFPAKKSYDDVKSAMFEKGIPFSKINKLFKYVGTQLGFVVDISKVRDEINAKIASSFFNFDSYEDFEASVSDLVESVDGATESVVAKCLAQHCLNNEIEVPEKPKTVKTAGRMGKLNRIYVDLFTSNPQATKQDLYEALVGTVKTDKNAQDYTNAMHTTLYAVANGLSVEDAINAVKDMKIVSSGVDAVDDDSDDDNNYDD